jgi:hypothetical protein
MGEGVRRRPNAVRWLMYAFGFALPAGYREWVLHDLTTGTWQVRQMLRSVVQVVPFAAAVVVLMPGELWVRLVAVIGGGVVGMIYAVAYLEEATEHRARKAGYPRGTLQSVRYAAHSDERAEADRRYAERYRRDDNPPGPE